MKTLANKKILFIAARFFGYETEIKLKLEELGAYVDFYDQRPSNSFFVKSLIRINKRFLSRTIGSYYEAISRATETIEYDYVLFISPEVITKKAFLGLKGAQKKAQFIMYMWDSFRNKGKNIDDIREYFDRLLSFDQRDCMIPNLNIQYRPLFFLDDYKSISNHQDKKYDLLFIGTIHSDRSKLLAKFKDLCAKEGLTYFYYLYFPSRILFYLGLLVDPSLWKYKAKEFKFHSLDKREIVDLMASARAVIDIQHPRQSGLTMRTIEVLGARRKLLTTNQEILKYDFYHPANIQVVDREHLNVDLSFLGMDFVPVEETVYQRYSIQGWINEVFSLR